MIITKLCGGLGNQMFQYSIGRMLALKYDAELVFDLDWYRFTPSSNTQRSFELYRYPIVAREASFRERACCRIHLMPVISKLGLRWGGYRLFREQGFNFDDSVMSLLDATYLSGYWQSYEYFNHISDLIQSELNPLALPSLKDSIILERMRNINSVSVHIRRGDYVSQKAAAAVHGICSSEYYYASLSMISCLVKNPEFFIFSDDISWAKENMTFPGPANFVDHNDFNSAFQDLRLMASCKHNIIANSSFSWWAAWLNSNDKKIVISPANWFADKRDTPTLIPKSWLRI
jgi:hypothetical protein